VLVTIHRRENHGERLDSILKAVKGLVNKFSQYDFILPVHPNPNVKSKVETHLSGINNVFLEEPLDYPTLINIMKKCSLILTDSGGIQEEAPSFGVPILVLRDHTERMEGVEAGFAKLVGADAQAIVKEAELVLEKPPSDNQHIKTNPYGDGMSSSRILSAVEEFFNN
jgi:UDP-N-acetylglucosamine 2-epimerase (non-hydrolysing)